MTKSKSLKSFALLALLLTICTGTAFASASIRVQVADGDESQTYLTNEQTVEEFLKEEDIAIGAKDILDTPLDYVLQDGDKLAITRAIPVTVYIDGVPKQIYTTEETVGDLKGYLTEMAGGDFTLENVTEDTQLNSRLEIQITTQTVNTYTTTEIIPYEIQVVEKSDMDLGTEVIVQEGQNGQKEITVTETIVGGEVVDQTTEETVLAEPVTAIVHKGTAQTVAVGGEEFDYIQAIAVKATAYTPNDPGCTGITSTGTVAGYGTLAVDPNVIPYGSKVYIPGYGTAIAEDTGGAIKGNRVDVCYPELEDALNWGVKNLTIYVLE